MVALSLDTFAQVENVPIENQVYEFLDRMNVRGILDKYSNSVLPISRREIGELLMSIDKKKDVFTELDLQYLNKFKKEFSREMNSEEKNSVLFTDEPSAGKYINDITSSSEKYLYEYSDSSTSLYVEFLSSFRHKSGLEKKASSYSAEQHGGRVRGTFQKYLGYFIASTNGTVFGDRNFALTEPKLTQNFKFNNLNTPYFDVTEGYIRVDMNIFQLEAGREFTKIGTGYSGRLLLSDNAALFDMIRLDAQYKSVRFFYLQGRLEQDRFIFPDLTIVEDKRETKYLAMHRLQFPLFDIFQIGVSEMITYQRFAPEWAYLNPFTFYKSLEHALGDRDNSLISCDVEIYPMNNVKMYGTWMFDDIDFKRIGSGWWGNEFAWQAGVFHTNVFGVDNFDAVFEYTRIEPYVYSNRVQGNNYTHADVSLGHHLQPNSDELFLRFNYRPLEQLRLWFTVVTERHGTNYNIVDSTVNVGGNVLEGHRWFDSEFASFLDGNLFKKQRAVFEFSYEPVPNYFLLMQYEAVKENETWISKISTTHNLTVQVRIEY